MVGKATENFTYLNTHHEQIGCEVFHLLNIPTSHAPKVDVMVYKLK